MKKYPFAAAVAALAAAGAAQAQPTAYTIDPTHTFVSWEASHFATSTNRGRFDKKDGSITFDRAGKTGKVDISIDTGSINTGTALFNEHLRDKNWFRSKEFPTARFVSETFVFDGDKVKEVAGTLTLLGKTNPVTLKASNFNCYPNPFFKREVCGGDFETTIQRSQWGMSYGIPGIPDNVRILVQIEAIKQ
jgi:polyisoprenoid-binding protein YceI